MPRRERERFGPWLIRQINSETFDGVRWLDDSRTVFRLPWKHLNIRSADEKDYGIFKAWAVCSGKYNPQCEDPPVWKTNFRCALNQVPYLNIKMFSEIEDHSNDQRDPHKKYRFNGVHHDLPALNPNLATFSEGPSNLEEQSLLNELNDEDYALRISPDYVLAVPFNRPEESEVIEELMRNILLDSTESSIQQVLNLSEEEFPPGEPLVDQVFRPSTQEQWEASQGLNPCLPAGHGEPSSHGPGFREQCTPYHTCHMYQHGFPQSLFQHRPAAPHFQLLPTLHHGSVSAQHELQAFQHSGFPRDRPQDIVSNGIHQDVSGVDQVIKPSPVRPDPPLLKGPRHAFVQETQETPLNPHGAHHVSYKTANSGCPPDRPGGDQGINCSPHYSYQPTNEERARSSPGRHPLPLVNGPGQASAPETQATLLSQQRRMPPVSSWEVTIYYRGKEVLKKNVSKSFFITSDIDEVQMEDADIVQFPSTELLADHLQIKYTNDILSCVGQGLLLEVNPDTYKVYATRLGKSRVFWSLSESLETQDLASESKVLIRDVPTEIFDFNQFWEELKGYKYHRRPSPDYTIYMAFGQILFEPVKRKFVLVKLVPNLCTFLHQAAQQSGASSLHSEVVSLQISNGSFGSFDLNEPCLMDLGFHDLL